MFTNVVECPVLSALLCFCDWTNTNSPVMYIVYLEIYMHLKQATVNIKYKSPSAFMIVFWEN